MSGPAQGSAERIGVAPLAERHIPATAALLAAAMEVDSAYRYLFPQAATRPAGLRDLFARNLALHVRHRCSYVACDDRDNVIGTVTLRPPDGLSISTLTMLRRGLLPFGARHGLSAVKRLLWLKGAYDGFEHAVAGGAPHWYVHMMAVRPDLQGQGLGAALLDRAFAIAGVPAHGQLVVLTTHLTRNLPFYARANFETRWQRTVEPPDAEPYPVWAMARK